jgi:hypothetical protein
VSHEGVVLVLKVALILFMILVVAVFKARLGPGRRRSEIMMLGTLGGISVGVFGAYVASHWLQTDVSAVGAALGITFGLSVGWLFARRVPHEAS